MGIIYLGSNRVSSEDYGVLVETLPNREFPRRVTSRVTVPGRSGDIVIDGGSYGNVSRSYNIAFGDESELFVDMADAVVQWLSNARGEEEYYELRDTYEPGVFRKARFDNEGIFNNIYNHAGRTTITFDCAPQRYLESGIEEVSLSSTGGTLTNPGMPSHPLIKLTGTGDAVLTVGSYPVNISDLSGSIWIDCDLMDAFHENENLNSKISLQNGWPVLVSGDNTITIAPQDGKTFEATSLKIIPRWWKL